jgi:hypothetical protein
MNSNADRRRPGGSEPLGLASYYQATKEPLQCLAFLLPLIVVYEVGTIWLVPLWESRGGPNVGAHVLLQWFIGLFGWTSFHVPGLAVVVILLAWHLSGRQAWKVRGRVVLGMCGESLLLALPLLVFQDALQAGLAGPRAQSWLSDVVLSVGAGVYEELIFRLGLISLGSLVAIDVLKLPRSGSTVAVVLISAGVFAAYHHVHPATEPFAPVRFLFRTAAGIYLGGVFALRGFGIAAGCHAVYNLIIVTALSVADG